MKQPIIVSASSPILKRLAVILLTTLRIGQATESHAPPLREPSHHPILEEAISHIYRQNTSIADSLIVKHLEKDPYPLHFFRGLILFSRFDDLGDTAALSQCQALWDSFLPNGPLDAKSRKGIARERLYQGLGLLQLSYLYRIRGKPIQSALLAKKALGMVKKQPFLEAELTHTVYRYYQSQILAPLRWLPFVSADPQPAIAFIHQNRDRSPYLAEIFRVSQVWMHFDHAEYDQGLEILHSFLKNHPTHRVYLQMKADLLFRKGDAENAYQLYLRSLEAYSHPSNRCDDCLPIRRLCAVGNLVRISASLGKEEEHRRFREEWFHPKNEAVHPWLPKGLKKSLEKYRK